MLPTLGSAKVDKILSQFSQRYTNDSYISELILPSFKVVEKTGKYAKYGTENLRSYGSQIFRAPGTRAQGVDYSVSQGEYSCKERSLEKIVPDEMVNNSDDPYDPKRDAVATLMDILWLNQEKTLADFFETATLNSSSVTLSGSDQWSDRAGSTPLDDIEDQISGMVTATGQRPNTAWMGFEVFRSLKSHPDVREQVKYTNGGQLSDGAFIAFLKEYFQLTDVFIGTAIYDSADEGQTPVLSQVWGKHFWLGYKNPRPSLMKATMGYTFTDSDRVVDSYREESRVGDFYRVRYSYDQNIMDANLICRIKNAVA